MKIWKILCIMSLLLLTMVFAGCSNEGDKYIGKWTGLENPDNPRSYIHQMTIEKNDDNFIIKRKIGSYNEYNRDKLEWHDSTEDTDSATLKDGKLVVDGNLTTTTYTYIEKDNTLLYSGQGGVYLQKDDDGKVLEELKKQAADALTKYWEEHPIIDKVPIIDDPFAKYGKTKW